MGSLRSGRGVKDDADLDVEGEGSKKVEGVRCRGTMGREGIWERRTSDGDGNVEIFDEDGVELGPGGGEGRATRV